MLRRLTYFLLAGTLSFLVFGIQPVDTAASADPAISDALDAVTTSIFDPAYPAASFPTNYPTVMGYRPVVGIGPDGSPILMKAAGDCSSFSGATEYRFDAVCKEHDLAYDVLRYSDLVGNPLPAAAREQADDMFDRQLHNQCTYSQLTGPDFPICHMMAESFALAVQFNSWRQGFRPPALHESLIHWALILLTTLVLLLVREVRSRWQVRPGSRLNDLRHRQTWLTAAASHGAPRGQTYPVKISAR